jgi:DNA-binding response OmpR family regulator
MVAERHQAVPHAGTAGTGKVYVNTLREKIEPNPAQPRYVIARRGLDYMFDAQ